MDRQATINALLKIINRYIDGDPNKASELFHIAKPPPQSIMPDGIDHASMLKASVTGGGEEVWRKVYAHIHERWPIPNDLQAEEAVLAWLDRYRTLIEFHNGTEWKFWGVYPAKDASLGLLGARSQGRARHAKVDILAPMEAWKQIEDWTIDQ